MISQSAIARSDERNTSAFRSGYYFYHPNKNTSYLAFKLKENTLNISFQNIFLSICQDFEIGLILQTAKNKTRF